MYAVLLSLGAFEPCMHSFRGRNKQAIENKKINGIIISDNSVRWKIFWNFCTEHGPR